VVRPGSALRARALLNARALAGLLVCGLLAAPLWAADPCARFRWDIAQERALFASSGQTLVAGHDAASAATVQPQSLYVLQLQPQAQVSFALPPARARAVAGAQAGIVRLAITQAGRYRISLDEPFWVDVVNGSQMLSSQDFQGVPGCNAPHKIVEFDLPAGNDLLLQVSGAISATLRLSVTGPQAPS
jgi:hypothetical protein